MSRLDDRIAVITGGAGAIGAAAARLFVGRGAHVVLVDVDEPTLLSTTRELGDLAEFVVADVANVDDTDRYVRATLDRHGRVDVFLANAGIEGPTRPIAEYPVEVFDRVLAVNVRGVFLGLQRVIPAMAERGGGSIVVTSSILGLKGAGIGLSAYTASKHAVIGLMRAAAIEAAPLGVRVNAIAPGFVEGPMMARLAQSAAAGGAFRERIETLVPLARYCMPDEVAQLLLFLAGDASRFCTGGVYSIDGGMSAR